MKILIGIVSCGAGSVVTTVIVGSRSFEGIVVDKPYERGLSWDREQKERIESAWISGSRIGALRWKE